MVYFPAVLPMILFSPHTVAQLFPGSSLPLALFIFGCRQLCISLSGIFAHGSAPFTWLLPSFSDAFSLVPLLLAYLPAILPTVFPRYRTPLPNKATLGFVVVGLFSGGAADDFILTAHCYTTISGFDYR